MERDFQNLISIIMPCFNAARYIKESVSSALGQTYLNIELIIVDDGSTDETPHILDAIRGSDERLRVFSQQNKGPGPTRNRGLFEARGAFIAFLDSDDFWVPECIEKLHAALIRHNADIAYCGWQNLGLPGGRGKPYIPPDYSKTNLSDIFLGGCPWPIHAALTRRDKIVKIGGFDERLTSCMDYDLWLRLSPIVEIVLAPEVLCFYRYHGGPQITKNRARLALNHWFVQSEFLKRHPDAIKRLGKGRIRQMTSGELLKRGYICYWDRDMEAARKIFRKVMKTGYGTVKDWKYMLPALLPINFHRFLIKTFTSAEETN